MSDNAQTDPRDGAARPSGPAPEPEIITEYAFVRDGVVVMGPTRATRWNSDITLQQAAEDYYDGAVVVTRTRAVYPDVVSDWEEATPT